MDVKTLITLTAALIVVPSYNSAIRAKVIKSTRNQSGPNGPHVQLRAEKEALRDMSNVLETMSKSTLRSVRKPYGSTKTSLS